MNDYEVIMVLKWIVISAPLRADCPSWRTAKRISFKVPTTSMNQCSAFLVLQQC